MQDCHDEHLRDIGLTDRQRRILRLLGISKPRAEIAAELGLSEAELEAEMEEMRKLFKSGAD